MLAHHHDPNQNSKRIEVFLTLDGSTNRLLSSSGVEYQRGPNEDYTEFRDRCADTELDSGNLPVFATMPLEPKKH